MVYIFDLYASKWAGEVYGSSRGGIILRIVIALVSVGAILGMYVTFKFGDIDEQIDELQKQNAGLVSSLEAVAVDSDDLKDALDAFQTGVDSICENKADLQSQVNFDQCSRFPASDESRETL